MKLNILLFYYPLGRKNYLVVYYLGSLLPGYLRYPCQASAPSHLHRLHEP